ncbi:hypothetical protein B0H19DRAFT_1135630 [Mycena capillaripes]|nr:hypothetical protein B0H19DRAFT_1135630 [Mycena capillaripes]
MSQAEPEAIITLPLEIVELVIDHSFHDRETLKTCSLVSLQWVPRSRFHGFRTVTLRNAHSIGTLVELLESPLSTLACAIRHLCVEARIHLSFSTNKEQEDVLKRLSDLCTIGSLQFNSFFRLFSGSEVFLPPWSCFKSVQFLRFGAVDAFVPDLLEFIAFFPMLRELEMDGLYWDMSQLQHMQLHDYGRAPPVPPPHLQAIRLRCSAVDVLLDWLLPKNAPSCSLLELSDISDRQIGSVSRYLSACGHVLHHLSLSLRLSSEDLVPLNLSRNTNLRYLRIEPDRLFETLPHILCTLTSASLTHIELVMPGRVVQLHPEAWADLDRHLLRPQFSRLRISVQLPHAKSEEIIARCLPLCSARGMITCQLVQTRDRVVYLNKPPPPKSKQKR